MEKFNFDFSKAEDQKNFEQLDAVKRQKIISSAQIEAGKISEKVITGQAENYQDAEKIVEKEQNAEKIERILEKAVNIRESKDLKYKQIDINLLPAAFSRGLAAGQLKFLKQEPDKTSFSYRKEIKEARKKIEEERNNGFSTEYKGNAEDNIYEKACNVYYPEGMLDVMKNFLKLDSDNESLNEEAEFNVYFKDEGNILLIASKCFYYLQTMFENEEYGLSDFANMLKNRTDDDRNEALREIFLNEENYEKMRKAWLSFFWHKSSIRMNGLQPAYPLISDNESAVLVLDPSLDVRVSYCDDYPTEAVVNSMRLKPRDIIGLIVDEKDAHDVVNEKNENGIKAENDNLIFENGKTYLEGYIKIAKQKEVPIYNTEGNMIWPKRMSRDKITEMKMNNAE